jgi:hypothetical protein
MGVERSGSMDDHVIDINQYLERGSENQERGTFSLWGSDGDRVRLAMPVWRAISLLAGVRGGVFYMSGAPGELRVSPFFVLDLEQEPARIDCPGDVLEPLLQKEPSAVAASRDGAVAVLLSVDEVRRWFLVLFGRDRTQPLAGRTREHLLFLAGECAGLLSMAEDSAGET